MGSIRQKLGPYRWNQNFAKNVENHNFKKFTIWNLLPTRLCRAATTKPKQIERSSFFLLDHNDKTRIYRLVSGSFDVPLQRKRDSPMEEDNCAPPPALIRVKTLISCFVVVALSLSIIRLHSYWLRKSLFSVSFQVLLLPHTNSMMD